MQVKRFEAPTIQEALEAIKKELGPEAIILQTRKNRKSFGALSKASVEVTAAISDRSIQKKEIVEKRIPEEVKNTIRNMSARRQSEIYDRYINRNYGDQLDTVEQESQREDLHVSFAQKRAEKTKEKVEFSQKGKNITATRYVEIEDVPPGPTRSRGLIQRSPAPAIVPPTNASRVVASSDTSKLEAQLHSLQETVEELKNRPVRSAVDLEEDIAKIEKQENGVMETFEMLVMNGVEKRYAYQLIKTAQFNNSQGKWNDSQLALDMLAEEMMNVIKIEHINDTWRQKPKRAIAVVGPTGVGKTTTLAKIANQARLFGKLKVGLVNLDHQKIGAFDQLATLAKILGVPFRSADNMEDLAAVMMDFKDLDLVLVDAAGYSQRDTTALQQLKDKISSFRSHFGEVESYLVLSATTRESELYDAVNRFTLFNPKGLIISKLDEAVIYGAIYNVSQRSKLPLVYFTTGQVVPDDIEEATGERLVALVLDIE